jgi:hypothetical protein
MSELRERAIERKAAEISEDVRRLERLSRGTPVAKKAHVAHAVLTDCTLTSCDMDELRRRACSGDENAVAELCRRTALPAAA